MITPREYQLKATTALYSYFSNNDGSPLLICPAGSGKSLILAMICFKILQDYPGERLLILSHDSRIIQQNRDELKNYWSKAPCGIFSASLNSRQFSQPIVFATVQSVFRKAHLLGARSIVFIDEAHLLSRRDNGMYNQLLAGLREINPAIKIVGLTASPFRLDSGLLTEGEDRIFTDICFEVKLMELLHAGHLTPLISRASKLKTDTSKVSITAGEFNAKQLEQAYDSDERIGLLLDESVPLLAGRKSILVFCTGISHAHRMKEALRARGISADAVSSKTPKSEQRRLLDDFKSQKYTALCSVGMLAVGFNAKCVDAILMDRATMSPGLLLQIAGRGMRLFSGKKNCIFLDAGSNLERLGPITHLSVPKRSTGRKMPRNEDPLVKICEICRTAHPLGTIECSECGNIMIKERDLTKKLDTKPADIDIMMTDAEYLEANTVWADVDSVRYAIHRKAGKPDSIRIEYQCGLMVYKEWCCLFHGGYAAQKAVRWWTKRGGEPVDTILQAMHDIVFLETPTRIRVRKRDKTFEVIDHDFGPARQGELAIGA